MTVNSILWSLPNTYFKGLKLDVNWCYAVYCNDRLALLIKLTPYTLHLSALWVAIDPPFKYAVFFFSQRPPCCYSLMNMRQLHILFNSAKTWHGHAWDFSVLMFKIILGSAQVNSGENTEINKQSHVKFWLNWIEYGAVSYSLSCTQAFLQNIY